MSRNKLYNKSYFSKRLIDAGFNVIKLNIPFLYDDYRRWVIIVNPSKEMCDYNFNIFVTCFKDELTKLFSFKFQGQNFEDFILNTKSMKLIIRIFNKTVLLFKLNRKLTAFNLKDVNQLMEQEVDE